MFEKMLLSLGWRRKKPVIRKSTKYPGFWECSSQDGREMLGETPHQAYMLWEYLYGPNRRF